MIRLIVGLGNPGSQYQKTRHNAGVWFLDGLLSSHPVSLRPEAKFLGAYAKINLHQHDTHLLMPTTFMNRSGQSVSALMKFLKLSPSQLLVVHDELDLPAGAIKLKEGGGHAGHNGLRDIISALGTSDFLRLRIGIGRPTTKEDVANYVLHAPGQEDMRSIRLCIDHALGVLPELLNGHIHQAIQKLHSGFRN